MTAEEIRSTVLRHLGEPDSPNRFDAMSLRIERLTRAE